MKLTLPQYDVYYEQLLYPTEPIYNIGAKIKIEGTIDVETFQKAYDALIRQHDAYRTQFTEENGIVVANIIEEERYDLQLIDFSNRENADEVANIFMVEEFVKPFQILSTSFLHTFILIKVNEQLHYLFSVYHHIITDGWGTSLMFQRLVKNYNEILTSGKVTTNYPFSYKDFVKDDEEYHNSEAFEADKNYWKAKFIELPENLFEKKEAYKNIHKSSRKSVAITREVYNEIAVLAKQYKVSTFHFILGVLYVYFGRKHQNKDFAIGLPVLNRSKSIFKKTVGLFMGVSPLRMQLNFEETFGELVSKIRNQLRQDYRHQRLPLGKLIQTLGVFNEKEKVFNITLSYEKQNYSHNFGDTKTRVIPLTHQSERVALAIYIREFDEKEDVIIDFDYNTNYFDEISINGVATHFETLVSNILKNPTSTLAQLEYIPKAEKQKLLVDFNQTETAYQKTKTFLDVFTQQVKYLADKVAVYDVDNEYTYGELEKKSNQVASYILSLTKDKNTNCIGVLVERSAELIAILLGILKAGKAYIPLDPTFPNERLQYIIEHSELEILISDQPNVALQTPTNEVLSTTTLWEQSKDLPENEINNSIGNSTAYIIYTSGSTGNPKGVEIGHASLLNFLLSMQQKPGIEVADSLFSVTTYSFDISILEFFAPLLSGATLYVATNETLDSPETIINTLHQVEPTIIQATPSFYQLLFNAGWNGNKMLKILCGGDALSKKLASKLLEKCDEVWNMYGPTETTIWSSVKQIKTSEDASNIGKPIANTQFYILDKELQTLPLETQGNIFIGGDGLALGYYKNQELTNEKFIKNPFGKGFIYETGDVGYWTSTGEIIFGGRNDNQVKIRGYRIELEDVETKLNALSTIKQAIVIPKKSKDQEAFLAAYIIPTHDNFKVETCRKELAKQLPAYMIPSYFNTLETFPMTLNKKVNRKVLINLALQSKFNEENQQKELTPLQENLLIFWKETLQYDGHIHINDNYFTLGGHSLNAVKLVYKINKELSYNISLKTIFENPTIVSLASYLETKKTTKKALSPILKATKKLLYKVTPSQYAIWLASQNKATSIAYNMVAAFTVDGNIDSERFQTSISRLIQKHEILRTNFVEKNGTVYQKITTKNDQCFSITELNKNIQIDEVKSFINTEFDLANDNLIKILILKENQTASTIVFCTHHIIMDGWSLELFTKDFVHAYKNTKVLVNTSGQLQFKDYSEWLLMNKSTSENTTFWNDYMSNYEPKESFKSDTIFENHQHTGSHFDVSLDVGETKHLQTFVQDNKTTMHNFLVAALQVLIFKLNHHTDISIGTVNLGRNRSEMNSIIGMFVKTLPLRLQLKTIDSFEKIIDLVQTNILKIDAHLDNASVQQTNINFDVLIAFQNTDFSHMETIMINNIKLTPYPIDVNYSRLPLLFNFAIVANELKLHLSYDRTKYNKDTIEWIWAKYQKLIEELIKSPKQQLSKIEIALPFEAEDTLDIDFNF
ncbi:amino acid adenylation domain-containing protein [uncultured Kordia sp.]|uniref:amino acid adenylation domain-containing protein n=1 Tax=uncultured Kordia sp. TaxID=507699 RepID=UPI002630FB73|nr:amino acid adenylation domain-containing protein [uncultured Kordia sp.]